MPIDSREQLVSELESLQAAAESGPLTPEDLSRFKDVVQCARDYVPDFGAGEKPMEAEVEGDGAPELSLAMLAGKPGPAAPPMVSDSKPPMLPPYKRREGR